MNHDQIRQEQISHARKRLSLPEGARRSEPHAGNGSRHENRGRPRDYETKRRAQEPRRSEDRELQGHDRLIKACIDQKTQVIIQSISGNTEGSVLITDRDRYTITIEQRVDGRAYRTIVFKHAIGAIHIPLAVANETDTNEE